MPLNKKDQTNQCTKLIIILSTSGNDPRVRYSLEVPEKFGIGGQKLC